MWRLAWRNLWRNRTRTIITGTAIAFTLALQLVSYGLADSSYQKMRQAAVTSAGGSILVHAAGYWESLETDKLVPTASAVAETVRAVEGVSAVVPRILSSGLITSARGSTGTRLMGIDRGPELAFSDVSRFLVEGTFLEESPADLRFRGPLVLGKAVVKDLKIKVGDRLVVAVTGPDGESLRIPFRLTGVFDTGSEMSDRVAAYTTLAFMAQQLGLHDTVVQLGVVLNDDGQRQAVAKRIKAALAEVKPPLEVLTWDEANPEMVQFIELDRQWGEMMGLVIFIVVAFGITNTFLMAVLERVRELGLLGALGLTPGRIARLMVAESVLLGLLAVAVGFLLGLAGHMAIGHYGIDYAKLMGGDVQISGVILDDMIIYSHLDPVRWGMACGAVMVLIVLAASYPAFKATRMEPATAMRTYE